MRILGITIPDKKRLEISLTVLFGVGRSRAQQILDKAKIDWGTKAEGLSGEQENQIKKIIEGLKIEGDLKVEIQNNIKRLREVGSYRGIRHAKNLPVRGQRTKSNARTKRGKRVTIGAIKKEEAVKMGLTSAPTTK